VRSRAIHRASSGLWSGPIARLRTKGIAELDRSLSLSMRRKYRAVTEERKKRPMLDRLQNVLPHLEHLPPEAQEEAIIYIEALAEALEREALVRGRNRRVLQQSEAAQPWIDPIGAWRDLPDSLLEDLEQLRHSNSSYE
jgi:hypothetical protein